MLKNLAPRKSFKNVFKKLCPLAFCDSVECFTSVLFILPKFNPKSVAVSVLVNLYYLVIVAEGFFFKFIHTRFLFIPTRSMGPFVDVVHFLWAISLFELFTLRTHCLYKMVRYGRGSQAWYDIAIRTKKGDHPIYFQIFRLLFIGVFGIASLAIVVLHALKMTERPTQLDYVVNSAWIIIRIILMRFTVVEFPYFYIVSFSCYMHVKEKMDNLLKDFAEPLLNVDLVPRYLTT